MMDDPADFTVLLPVYGKDDPAHFKLAFDSVALSSQAPAEILICQDGVLPEPLRSAVSDAARRGGVRLARNLGPAGLARNLNHGLNEARTAWIARADADDINLPERFARQVEFLRRHCEVAVLGGGIVEFAPDGARRRKPMPLTHDDIVRQARWRNPINHMTAFFRRDAALACGGYPIIPYKEDYGLWLTMIAGGYRLANLGEDLVEARLGESFHERRSGAHNLASEYALFRIKREIPGLRQTALAAMIARAGALTSAGMARLIYQTVLRR